MAGRVLAIHILETFMLRAGSFALTILLAALSAVGPLTTDMYLPSLPDIARQLGASTAQVQLTLSAYLIGFALGQIFYGPIADRHGRRPVLIGALTLYCLASLACALSTSVEMLIVARFVQGVGGSGGIVLARAVVRDLYTGVRAGRELSIIGSVTGVAPVLAPIAGGLLQSAFGWRAIFITLVIAGVMGVTVVWLIFQETLRERAADRVSPRSMFQAYRIVVRHPAYLAYLALATTSYAGLFAWISGASFVLQNLYGLNPFNFGIAFAVGSLGYIFGAMLSARLVVRIGVDGTLGVGAAMLALGGVGMVATIAFGLKSPFLLVLPVSIYLAGLGTLLPQAIAGAMGPFPDRAGAASSLLGFIQQSAAAICGALVGWLLGANAWPLAAAVASMGCATLAIWLLTRRIRAGVHKI